jgi:hypothetical protein
MHRFKGRYINSAKTYCQSTIVADFWSWILLLLLLITVCNKTKEPGYKCKYKFCKAPIMVLLIWADVLAAQERILHRISTGF